jgi:hypothetical protein
METKKLLVTGIITGLLFLVLDMIFAIATMSLLGPSGLEQPAEHNRRDLQPKSIIAPERELPAAI